MFEPLTRRLERLSGDERGVSPVVGFVLIFALVMLVFTIYQAEVVPAQNQEVEFKHSQGVEADMSRLSDAIQQAGTSGVPQSVTIDTGVQYPNRALAINPGSPAGTLQTSKPHSIELSGIDVKGSKYWDGSTDPNDFKTASLSYSIEYNAKQSDPTFTLANGVMSKSYDSGSTLAVGDSAALVPGTQRQIDLTLLGGQYQKSELTANPTVKPISTSTQYLHFEAKNNPTIGLDSSLTTAQCTEKWKGLLGKNYDSFSGEYPNSAIDCSNHEMDLKSGTNYTLRISKIVLGDTSGLSDAANAHEVVPTEKDEITGPGTAKLDGTPGEEISFTVLVRDKYGNPVSTVDLTASGGKSVDESNIQQKKLTTNENGETTFTYRPGSKGDKTITITSDEADYDAIYKFDVTDSSSDDDSSDGEYSPGPPQIETVVQPSGPNSQGLMSFDIRPKSPIEVEGFAVETRYDLSEINETDSTHEFVINDPPTTYSQSESIQLDGRKYELDSPVTIDSKDNTQIELHEFTSEQPSFAITDVVDSPREADLMVIFFLTDGSQRAVYFDGDTN